MKYTIVLLVQPSGLWHALPREERDQFVAGELYAMLKTYRTTNKVRLFDHDFNCACVADFILIETNDLMEYSYLVDAIRESTLFGFPYFKVKELVMGVDNHFASADMLEVA